jgi:hypothetical protein
LPGASRFLTYLAEHYSAANVVIYSSRAKTWRGRRAIRSWLKEHSGAFWFEDPFTSGVSGIKVTAVKPPASVYLDDRAVRFEGKFPELLTGAIRDFANQPPWFSRPESLPEAVPNDPDTVGLLPPWKGPFGCPSPCTTEETTCQN